MTRFRGALRLLSCCALGAFSLSLSAHLLRLGGADRGVSRDGEGLLSRSLVDSGIDRTLRASGAAADAAPWACHCAMRSCTEVGSYEPGFFPFDVVSCVRRVLGWPLEVRRAVRGVTGMEQLLRS